MDTSYPEEGPGKIYDSSVFIILKPSEVLGRIPRPKEGGQGRILALLGGGLPQDFGIDGRHASNQKFDGGAKFPKKFQNI